MVDERVTREEGGGSGAGLKSMGRLIGFGTPNGGLIYAQVIEETPRDWRGVGGHLSTNQSYAEYDANRIAFEKRGEGWPYQWVGIFDNQDEMDHFQQWHPPEPDDDRG